MNSGYADVNGLHMYYEIHGEQGTPVVLLHGGVMTIELTWEELIPVLAQKHRVIAVETQAHGRTADIDRDITYPNMASDVVALLDELGIDRAHVVGHSMGGGTALELAISHPERVLSIVPMSASVSHDATHPDLLDPSKFETSPIMPTADDFAAMGASYAKLSPHPEKFEGLPMRTMASSEQWNGWTPEQLGKVTAPVLIVLGDNDFAVSSHGPAMQAQLPSSQLAILPGTTHMQVPHRPELLPMVDRFLD